MQFTIKNPKHLLALLLLIASLLFTILLPIWSYFNDSSAALEDLQTFPEFNRILFEAIALIFQLVVVIFIFIIIPLLWYILVNNETLKGFFSRIKLHLKNLDMVILWAVIAVIIGYAIVFAAGYLMTIYNQNLEDVSNIPDLELIFSLPSILILIIIQPVGEEIFYRGFLLDKITALSSEKTAIITTGCLFGIAHITYANLYPAIFTALLGMVFAYAVVKTKNLMTGILAHIAYNVISILLYIFARSILFEQLIF